MLQHKIKVGLLIDGFSVPAWMHETIKRITQTDYIDVAVVVKNQSAVPAFNGLSYLVYNNYCKLSRKYGKAAPKAFLRKSITEFVKNIPVENISLAEPNADAIKNYSLDILIKFSFAKAEGDILNAAKLGVWTFDNETIFGSAGAN